MPIFNMCGEVNQTPVVRFNIKAVVRLPCHGVVILPIYGEVTCGKITLWQGYLLPL